MGASDVRELPVNVVSRASYHLLRVESREARELLRSGARPLRAYRKEDLQALAARGNERVAHLSRVLEGVSCGDVQRLFWNQGVLAVWPNSVDDPAFPQCLRLLVGEDCADRTMEALQTLREAPDFSSRLLPALTLLICCPDQAPHLKWSDDAECLSSLVLLGKSVGWKRVVSLKDALMEALLYQEFPVTEGLLTSDLSEEMLEPILEMPKWQASVLLELSKALAKGSTNKARKP